MPPASSPDKTLILNRYRALETRGHGGFARVDVAWDTRLRRRVAMKRIPLMVAESDLPGIEEARTAAMLEDPHIVAVYDFAITGTEALLIMENVDGPTLAELMAASSELFDLHTVAAILSAVSQALEHAHDNQVLHLDIKPANILISHSGNVKVSDFGLAELSSTAGFSEAQGGTIGYMPPEQLEMGAVDERSDLWALAALAYQLLTGKNPFLAETPQGSLALIENNPVPLPSALRPELDPSIDDVLVSALNAEKDVRPAKVKVFWRTIAPCLGKTQTGRKNLKALVLGLDAADDPEAGKLETTQQWAGGKAASACDRGGGDRGGGSLLCDRGDGSFLSHASACDKKEPSPLSHKREPPPLSHADAYTPDPPGQAPQPKRGRTRRSAPALPLWQRFGPRTQTILVRLLAAVAAGTSAWLAASSLVWLGAPALEVLAADGTALPLQEGGLAAILSPSTPVLFGEQLDAVFAVRLAVSVAVAVLALFSPSLGAVAIVIALSGACFVAGYPLLGVGVLAGLAVWWACCGRRDVADAVVFSLTPLAGTLGLCFLMPLLAGCFLPWRRALGTTLASWGLLAVLTVICSPHGSLGSQLPLFASLSLANPGSVGAAYDIALYLPYIKAFSNLPALILLPAGLLATFVAALLCKGSSRLRCMAACLLATVIMGIAAFAPLLGLWPAAGSGSLAATDPGTLLEAMGSMGGLSPSGTAAASLAATLVLGCLLTAAGAVPAKRGAAK